MFSLVFRLVFSILVICWLRFCFYCPLNFKRGRIETKLEVLYLLSLATVSNKESYITLSMAYHFIGLYYNMSFDNCTYINGNLKKPLHFATEKNCKPFLEITIWYIKSFFNLVEFLIQLVFFKIHFGSTSLLWTDSIW